MNLQLPDRTSGKPITINTEENRQILIIGANGSGKTRFARQLEKSVGDKAFRLSALKAAYDRTTEDPSATSVDSQYHVMASSSGIIRADIKGELERIIAMLINEEMITLMTDKYIPAEKPKRTRTKLDLLIKTWTEIFPENRILVERGKLLIGGVDNDDFYSSSKLSAGESAAMYYIAASLYAPPGAVIFVESPETFLHPSTMRQIWDKVEQLRADCTYIYVTHDLSFATSRGESMTVWVKSYDPENSAWDYDTLPSTEDISEEVYMAIVGARKPVLFIEGDGVNSIDSKLYPLIFDKFTVKSLGGCDRVIEATRTFNSLKGFHNLAAAGIVDRDRRDSGEVNYLRERNVYVPEVAEIENIFMIEEVVRTVAAHFHRDEDEAFAHVSRSIIRLFETDLHNQALQHTRQRVKKTVEHRIDGRFANINKLEEHINDLAQAINPRGMYEQFCREFRHYVAEKDYRSILRVYNRKSMLSESHVAKACGLKRDDKKDYIRAILNILKENRHEARRIRQAIFRCFGLNDEVDINLE
ncbi:MAG: DUF4435 domain-containing protein [Lachnoclostridium sp.]|nr:DUF4435 domain-containing protein [Lachnoclostridium sp.]